MYCDEITFHIAIYIRHPYFQRTDQITGELNHYHVYTKIEVSLIFPKKYQQNVTTVIKQLLVWISYHMLGNVLMKLIIHSKHQGWNRQSLRMDKYLNPILDVCSYLSMLGFKLIDYFTTNI